MWGPTHLIDFIANTKIANWPLFFFQNILQDPAEFETIFDFIKIKFTNLWPFLWLICVLQKVLLCQFLHNNIT